MTVKKRQLLELKIEKLVFGGRGLGRVDGLAVFVDRTAPGDEVRVRVYRKKKNHAEARLLEVMRPSPFRVTPPCRYSGFCGGCPWQFLDYQKQLSVKKEHVVESLEHIGALKGIPVHPVLASPKIFQYRNKMEFSFSDRRWLMPEELSWTEISRDFALGLHVPGNFDRVFDLDTCLIQPHLGNEILAVVREHAKETGISPYGLRSHEGFWRFLMLRHSVSHDAWMVNIVTSQEEQASLKPLASRLYEGYKNVTSVVNNVNTKKASIAIGERESLLAGEPFIRDRIGGFEFEISANSFFQTNTRGAERLYEVVRDYCRLTGRETLLDLYSGTGTIPVFLAREAEKILGIDISETAVEDARRNCRRNRVENCAFLRGDIRTGLGQVRERPHVMVTDPPRAGMHPDVLKGICALRPARIVYVSCNPATLARDLALLKDHYRVAEVQPVDMFPHTHHIECVARLESLR
jgi:23S rRNA (uracil1939-C5)-methyltransferase